MTESNQTGSHPAGSSDTESGQNPPSPSKESGPNTEDVSGNPANTAAESSEAIAPDWASALAEQSSLGSTTQADGLPGADEWARALAAQSAGTRPDSSPPASSGSNRALPAHDVFEPLRGGSVQGDNEIDLIMDIPVQLSVELGRTKLTIRNILQLGQGSVVELDGLAGEPMDIFVNGYLIAQGEVVVVDDKYGIRLTDIITPADRLGRINNGR